VSAPPVSTTTQHKRRNHERRVVSVDALIADTTRLLAASEIDRSPSWVVRQVRAYAATPMRMPIGLWIAARLELSVQRRAEIAKAHPELAYCLGYSDPTGEQAVRNAMRAAR